MNDGEALLAAILDAPDDDLRRLIYADWLDDNGQGERAEFIRAQLELARPHECRRPGRCFHCGSSISIDDEWVPASANDPCFRRGLLRPREERLRLLNQFSWLGISPKLLLPRDKVPRAGLQVIRYLTWRRGFLAEITLTLQAWLDHGPALVLAQPIERVELRDRKPHGGGHCSWWWYRQSNSAPSPLGTPAQGDDAILPDALFDCLDAPRSSAACFDSRDAAIDALSAACLAWAKGPQFSAGDLVGLDADGNLVPMG